MSGKCFLKWSRKPVIRQGFAAMSCFISIMTASSTYYWMAPYTTWLITGNHDMHMTITEYAWLTSIIEVGAIVGCIPSAYIADRWGRKTLVFATGPAYLAIWILSAFTKYIPVLYLIRILQGLLLAVSDSITSVYVAEISSPERRGTFVGFFTVFWNLGVLYIYTLGNYLPYNDYLITLTVLPILFCVTFILMPESPYYYFMVNNKEKAKKSLAWLRYGEDIEEECEQIEASVLADMKNKATWKELVSTKSNRRALFIVQMVCISRYMIGVITITAYAEEALSKVGNNGMFSPSELSIFMAFIFAITAFISSFFSDSVGRRKMLLFSLIGCTITNILVAIYYYLLEKTQIDVKSHAWILYLNLMGFCIFSNAGLVQLMPTIKAEYFPTHIRSKGSAVTSLIAALCVFVQLRLYIAINESFGIYMNFIIFAIFALIAIFLVVFYLTESAGKTFAQINQEIKELTENLNK